MRSKDDLRLAQQMGWLQTAWATIPELFAVDSALLVVTARLIETPDDRVTHLAEIDRFLDVRRHIAERLNQEGTQRVDPIPAPRDRGEIPGAPLPIPPLPSPPSPMSPSPPLTFPQMPWWMFLQAVLCANEALMETGRRFQMTGYEARHATAGTGVDAYRHALWSCCLSRNVGPRLAEELLDARERENTNEDLMDLRNNKAGRQMHQSPGECKDLAWAALQDGRLWRAKTWQELLDEGKLHSPLTARELEGLLHPNEPATDLSDDLLELTETP